MKMKKLNQDNCCPVSVHDSKLSSLWRGTILLTALTLILTCPPAEAATKFEQLSQDGEIAYKNRHYPEAEKAFQMAIKEAADSLDKTDKRIATTVYNLGLVLQAEGNYAESEKNMLKSLELMISFYGAENQRVARTYMDIADLYVEESGQESKPELKKKAAENYQKGIDIFEKLYAQATSESDTNSKQSDKPPADPLGKAGKKSEPVRANPQDAAADLANALRVLADTYAEDERYKEAEPLYKRSLELEEYAAGPESKDLARHKAKLAETYCVQGNYASAAPLFKDALTVTEKQTGLESPETAHILYNYGGMHYDQGEFGDAEVMFKRAIKILAKDTEVNELDLAQKNVTLADVLDMEGKAEEAQALYVANLPVFEKNEDKTVFLRFLKQYQKHLLMQNKKDEAGKIAARIKEIKAGLSKQP